MPFVRLLAFASVALVAATGACSVFTSLDDLHGSQGGGSGGGATGGADASSAGAGAAASSGSGGAGASASAGSGGQGTGATGSGGASDAYAALVLMDGPLGYWRFDEASGPIAKDASGNAHYGVYANVMFGAAGAIAGDTAVGFNGTDSTVTFGDLFDFVGQAPFSVEFWLKVPPNWAGYRRVVSKEWSPTTTMHEGWDVVVTPTNAAFEAKFERWSANTNTCAVISQVFSANAYVHIVATYDGAGTVALYINSQLASYVCSPNPALLDTSSAFVAGEQSGTASVDDLIGSLDELAVYDKALPLDRILAHYEAGFSP